MFRHHVALLAAFLVCNAAASPQNAANSPRLRGRKPKTGKGDEVASSNRSTRPPQRGAEAEHFWLPFGGSLGHVVDDEGDMVSEVEGSLEDCQAACDEDARCKSFLSCRGHKCFLKAKHLTGHEPTHYSWKCTSYFQTDSLYQPADARLSKPSTAPALSFYVYRSQGPAGPDGDYPLANVNTASIGGAMWYLHNEVIGTTSFDGQPGARRFNITRLRRFKVTYKTPQPLWDRGMHFGAKLSFDSGKATGPFRPGAADSSMEWKRFGYYVGCDYLGQWPHVDAPFSTTGPKYPAAIWYSHPGPCPTMDYKSQTDQCKAEHPGGLCDSADGRGDCTYSVENAGEIDIDELVGIKDKYGDRVNFEKRGCFEGDGHTYRNGQCIDFWNDIQDQEKNQQRVRAALAMFEAKYPGSPKGKDMPTPKCDFDYQNYFAE